jgi:predicted acylesterase/phospholipase RssA
MTPTRSHSCLKGYTEILAHLAWLNVYAILAAVVSAAAILTDQGFEFIRISRAVSTARGEMLTLHGPLAVSALLLSSCSLLSAHSGAREFLRISNRHRLSGLPIASIAYVFAPVLLALIPTLSAAYESAYGQLWITAAIIGILLAGVLGFYVRPKVRQEEMFRRPNHVIIFGVAMVSLAICAICFGQLVPPPNARAIGTVGIVVIACSAWALALSALFVAIPVSFGYPNLAVVPVLALIGAGYFFDPNVFPHYSASRPEPPVAGQGTDGRPNIESQLKAWARRFEGVDGDQTIPLYLVSAEGGGIRAAYWSAAVLSRINEATNGEFQRHIFALSGVSGGSLGIAAFAAAAYRDHLKSARMTTLLDSYLSNDFLSPLVSRLVITEPIRETLGHWSLQVPRDVAFENVLASDWQRALGTRDFAQPFLSVFDTDAARETDKFLPAILLNSTIVETGQRAVVSNTKLEDLYYLPTIHGGDVLGMTADLLGSNVTVVRRIAGISVAEAVHLGARFPYLSPPATLLASYPGGWPSSDAREHVWQLWGHLVDGGYVDNSAADLISDFVAKIRDLQERAIQCEADADNCFEQGTSDWRLLAQVFRRLKIICLVIRNDPFDDSWRAGQSPALTKINPYLLERSNSPKVLTPYTELLTPEGSLKSVLGELFAPPSTVLATRDGRALVTRQVLRRQVSGDNVFSRNCRKLLADELQRSEDSQKPMAPSIFLHIGLSPTVAERASASLWRHCSDAEERMRIYGLCSSREDHYEEISLSSQLRNTNSPCMAAMRRFDNPGRDKDVPLGWTLSPEVREALACLAAHVALPISMTQASVGIRTRCDPGLQ